MAMQSSFIKRIRDIMRMDAGINGDAQRIEQMVWMLFLKVYDAKEDDWALNEDNYESIIPEDLRWRNWAKADGSGHAMTGDKLLNFVNNTLFPVLKGNDVKDGDAILYEGIKVTPDTPIKKAIVKSTFEDDIEIPNIYHMNSLKHNLLDYTDDDKFDVILMNPPYGGHEDKSIQGFFPDDLASSETADLFMSVILYRLKKNGRAAVVVPDGFLFGLDNAKVNIKKKLISQFNLHTIVRLPGSVFSPYTSITTNLLFFDNTKPTTETWFYRVDIPSDRKHFSKTKPMELKHFDDCIAWWNDRKEITDGENFKAQKFTAEYLLNEQGCNIDLCGYPHEEEEILDPMDTIREYQERRTALNAEIDKVLAELEALLPGGVSE